MRLFLICVLGSLATACGLSMNPDLPSAADGGGRDSSSGDGDDFFDDGAGSNTDDPDHIPPTGAGATTGAGAHSGSGGSAAIGTDFGGAGGATDDEGDSP